MGETVNPLAALGLPPTWQPGPIAWSIASLDVASSAGRETLFVLMLDGANGRNAYAFNRADMERFLDSVRERVGGIAVARIGLPANGRGGPPGIG